MSIAVFIVVLLAMLFAAPIQHAAQAGEALTAIYLNGVGGNDANDGSSPGSAVATFARAKELAAANQGIITIYITGTVSVSGELSLDGTNAMLKREATFTQGPLLNVAAGQSATVKDMVIDGNHVEAVGTIAPLVKNLGTLNIEVGAVLQNNQTASRTQRTLGGAVHSSGGTVNMSGGVIQNNSATKGGGIMLDNRSTLNMTGGVIQDNDVINGPNMAAHNDAAAGGGVCLYDAATFNLSGDARIQRNTSEALGGGISVGTSEVTTKGDNKLLMTGGVIDGNTSRGTGGGIFIQAAYGSRASMASVTAGSITNNSMLGGSVTNNAFGGGGIYVNGIRWDGFKNGQLFLENVVITDNTAALFGGGYASCPISYTRIYLTNGAAIYGNDASSARDVYIYSDTNPGWGAHAGNPVYEISSTMLGGTPYRWLYPDGSEVPLSKLSGTLMGDGVGFGMYTEATGDANTQDMAKVFITGNTSATRGGGVGSNGDVIIGKADDYTSLSILKTWADEENVFMFRPEAVEVEVWRKLKDSLDPPVYIGFDRVIPDAQTGEWDLTLDLLPVRDESDQPYEYSLQERPVPRYNSSIEGNAADGFTVLNTLMTTTEVQVRKAWLDADNQDGARPEHITVHLFANTVDTGKTLTLNAANAWQGTFTELDKYKEGQEIAYTIAEGSLPDGYSAVITGDAAAGFTITNIYTAPPTPTPSPAPTPRPTDPPPPTPSYPILRVLLPVNKVLKNGTLKGGEFIFQLKDRQGKVLAEAQNAADGTVTFPERTFSKEVTNWLYTIHEVPGSDPKVTYDSTVYTVKVTTQASGGQLQATLAVEKDGTPYAGTITFTNQRQVPPTGDSTYQTIALLVGLSAVLMGGAYALSRKSRKTYK